MNLRPYQVSGKADIYREWELSDVLFYVLCTGGGKTFQTADIIKDFLARNLRCMFVAHTDELIQNSWNTLYQNEIFAGIIKGTIKTNYDLPCQVCSIQTIMRRSWLPHADLIVIDEGHHATADNSYGKLLQRYPNAKVIVVSATPYRLDGKGFVNLMPGKETRLIINSTIKSLIDDGWLCPFRYFIASIPDLSDAHLTKEGNYVDEDAIKAMKLAPLVESYIKHVPGKQGVTFGVNTTHSEDIAAQYWRKGIPSAHLDYTTPDEDYTDENGILQPGRKRIISDYGAGLIKLVTNCNILSEGVDFPGCDFVQHAAPTKALNRALQRSGRATRAERGLVDQFFTSMERRNAIANSKKPHAIILDNAGIYMDHGFPDAERDWIRFFSGWKKEKKSPVISEMMEIEIFVAIDEKGNTIRAKNIKEVEGMELIEVTREIRRKVINIRAIHEFDNLYFSFRNSKKIPNPGNLAFNKYIEYCRKSNILMVPEVWDYLHQKLIKDNTERVQKLENSRRMNPDAYPEHVFAGSMKRINADSINEKMFVNVRRQYLDENDDQIKEYLFSKK